MTAAHLRHIAMHTVGAAVLVFVLNYFVLKAELQSSLTWAAVFGGMAAFLAWQQTKR